MIVQLFSIRPESSHRKMYIARNIENAKLVEKLFCIPKAICLAQAIYESGYGTSELCHATNNHFGIKWYKGCGQDWHQMVKNGSKWRCYESVKQSYLDYGWFMDERTDIPNIPKDQYKKWAFWIAQTGYGGKARKKVIRYKRNIISIIEKYKLNEL